MIDLYLQIQQTFNLTPLQVEKLKDIKKYRPDLLEKAFRSTQKYKPGNLEYFKGAYKHYLAQTEKTFTEKVKEVEQIFYPPIPLEKYKQQWKNKPWAS